jgi:peptidoglycan/LPS O-acetylase OafA/YrhL
MCGVEVMQRRVHLLIALFLIGMLLALVNIVVHGASPRSLLGTAVMVVGLLASLTMLVGEARSERR